MGAVEVIAMLRAQTGEFMAKMGEARAEVAKLEKSGGSSMEQFSKVGNMALLGIGAAAVGVGVAAVDMAEQYDKAHVSLETAAKAAGTSFANLKPQIDATSQQMEKYGFTNAQTESAVASLVVSQGKNAPVMKDMSLAANIAAARHIDLQTAIGLVEKAANGQTKALKQMGIDLPIAAAGAVKVQAAQTALATAVDKSNAFLLAHPDAVNASSKSHAAYEATLQKVTTAHEHLAAVQSAGGQILDALSKRFSGQASAASQTLGGKLAAMEANGKDLLKTLGEKLIPVLDTVVTAIMRFVTWLEKNQTVAVALGIGLAAVTVALLAMSIAGAIAEATFSPIILIVGLVVLAIGLLAFGIYELVTHWKTVWGVIGPYVNAAWGIIKPIFDLLKQWLTIEIKIAIDIVRGAFEIGWAIIKTVISVAWDIIRPIWTVLRDFMKIEITGAIIILQAIWNAAWPIISAAVSTAWNVAKPIFGFIKTLGIDVIQTAVSALQSVWNGAWSAISGAVSTAWSVMQPVIATITGAVGDAQKAWDWLFGGGGQPAHNSVVGSGGATINPPHKASGGSVTGLTPYLVGEQGPELFTPAASGSITPNNALGGGGSNQPINVTLQIDGQTLAQVLLTNQLRMKRTGGYGSLGLA